ncbi:MULTISPECIES: ABC transporter ATP-binding protein [unclassified Acinetobacter]|uniref:ABC transporter ATP-binding protein n=1 Tax=unclassified Acinetobacter TaxID=196816 RepID=UPI0035B9DF2E
MKDNYKLKLENICHHFEQKPLFENLHLNIQQGQIIAIVGTSGVGKTTLFNIAAGLIAPSQGKVFIDGQDVTAQAGHVGYMLQKDLLLPFKSVYGNIALSLTLKNQSSKEIEEKIQPLLNDFGLTGLEHKYPHLLSGGQRQRAALLRTYLSNQNLMLLDEPFSALDFVTKNNMYTWFKQFQQKLDLTCLIITHDIDEAIYLADRIYILKGFPAQLTQRFDIPKQNDFLQSQDYLKLKQHIFQAIQA